MDQEKYRLLNPLRYLVAVYILTGGLIHGITLFRALFYGGSFPWFFYPVLAFAAPNYTLSAILVLMNRRLGYLIAAVCPLIGGAMIFPGFFFPESGLLTLIPGTVTNEITITSFLTLISEPVASILAIYLLVNRIWEYKSG